MVRITLDLKADAAGWRAAVLGEDGQPVLDPDSQQPLGRAIRRPGNPPDDPLWQFPMPPAEEAEALPADAPQRTLCLAESQDVLRQAYGRILDRDTRDHAVERFGRYLFTTMLGQDLWAKILAEVAGQPFELALRWDSSEAILNRYPWEMMHDGKGFLAFLPNLSITRRVAFNGKFPDQVDLLPRVLFVMGTGLEDDRIRPGAEYMSMVRTLRYAGLLGELQTQVLMQATTERLEKAVQRFRPTMVHFICHGWFDEQKSPYLELYDEQLKAAKRVYPSSLLELLRAGDPPSPPPVVVLSACLSATVDEQSQRGEPGIPFASSLIQAHNGVPVVVGMAGQVTDQACRLFTRRFYEALLCSKDIAVAVAEGRRAAAQHGGYDPHAEADWAFPTLFLGDGVAPCFSFAAPDWLRQAQQAAKEYALGDFPPFCDRLRVLESYDLLLADTEDQKAVFQRNQGIQALAFRTDDGCERNEPGPRFGRTWQLKDLAARAARDGHLPVLIRGREDEHPPSKLLELLDQLDLALELTAEQFDLQFSFEDWHWKRVRDIDAFCPGQKPDPANLPDELKQKWEELPEEVRKRWDKELAPVIGRALRCDLISFLAEYRSTVAEPERERVKLVLLFDDLDRMSEEVVSQLLHDVLGPYGLRKAREDTRVAFVYLKEDKAKALRRPAIKAVVKWLGENVWAETIPLKSFESGLEQQLAYQRLLFNWKEEDKQRRLTVVTQTSKNADEIKSLFESLSDYIGGVPSDLIYEKAYPMVVFGLKFKVLKEAGDDQAFSAGKGDGQ